MDARLLHYYNEELAYLRELGQEFADAFPQVAAGLDPGRLDGVDPHVERLLEGCAFLSARVRLMLDAQTAAFAHRLIDRLHPSLLMPTPAMLVAQLQLSPAVTDPPPLPRGSTLTAPPQGPTHTRCLFRTSQRAWLTAARVDGVRFTHQPSAMPRMPWADTSVRSALLLSLSLPPGQSFSTMTTDRLRWFLAGPAELATRLLALMLTRTVAVMAGPAHPLTLRSEVTPAPVGHRDDEALLADGPPDLPGLRRIQEHLAFPECARFVDLTGLGPLFASTEGPTLHVAWLFSEPAQALEGAVSPEHLLLNCVPAINLFPLRADPLLAHPRQRDLPVVARRLAPLDYEVLAVRSLALVDDTGHVEPLADDRFSLRRQPRRPTERERRHGMRSRYPGSELFVTLPSLPGGTGTDTGTDTVRRLSAQLLCSNRDLPLSLAPDAVGWTVTSGLSITGLRVCAGPSQPIPAPEDQQGGACLLALLAHHHGGLQAPAGSDPAASLRELLSLLPQASSPSARACIEALRRLEFRAIVRRHPGPGPMAFARGIQARLTLDESLLAGASAYPFGAALHGYLSRQASLNQLFELVLLTADGAAIAHWPSTHALAYDLDDIDEASAPDARHALADVSAPEAWR